MCGDGKRVLTGSHDETAVLWDADNGKPLQTFKGHASWVLSVDLSGDGTRALTASTDRTAILWDTQSGKPVQTFKRGWDARVVSARMRCDGKRVLTGSDDKTAILWDAQSGKPVQTFKGYTESIWSMVLSEDGKRLMTVSLNGKTGILWDTERAMPLLTFRRNYLNRIQAMALSGDGRRILTASERNTFDVWDANSGVRVQTFKGDIDLGHVALSRDGKRALSAGMLTEDKMAILWDADNGKSLQTFRGHTRPISAIALSWDGKRVLTGSVDSSAVLWDAGSDKPLQVFRRQEGGHTDRWIESVALSGDSKRVLTQFGSLATLWDAVGGRSLQTFEGDRFIRAALSKDGKRILTGSADMSAILWDGDSGRRLQTFKGHNGDINSVAFGPDCRCLATASDDGTVRIWKPGREDPVLCFLAAGDDWLFWTPEGYYTCSPNGEHLIAWKIHDDSPQGYHIANPEHFRSRFYRPDLFRHLLREFDLQRALARADEESGRNPSMASTIGLAPQPVVIIAQPLRSATTINTEECELVARAKPTGENYVASLRLFVDGRPYEGGRADFVVPQPKAGAVSKAWKINLTPGKHLVQVIAESVNGSKSDPAMVEITRVDEPVAIPKLLLLSVGVSNYAKAERRGVEFAGSDAKRFLDVQIRHSKALYTDVESIPLSGCTDITWSCFLKSGTAY